MRPDSNVISGLQWLEAGLAHPTQPQDIYPRLPSHTEYVWTPFLGIFLQDAYDAGAALQKLLLMLMDQVWCFGYHEELCARPAREYGRGSHVQPICLQQSKPMGFGKIYHSSLWQLIDVFQGLLLCLWRWQRQTRVISVHWNLAEEQQTVECMGSVCLMLIPNRCIKALRNRFSFLLPFECAVR